MDLGIFHVPTTSSVKMPGSQEFQLHPLGWETDPDEERFRLSTLDYLTASTYNNYALFFKLGDVEKR